MNPPKPPQASPQDFNSAVGFVADEWTGIENDPQFKQMSTQQQSVFRHTYWTDRVLKHPSIVSGFQQDPDLAGMLHKKFFESETNQLDAEVAKHAQPLYEQPIINVGDQLGIDPVKHPIARGVADVTSGLTSVENLGILGATMVTGPLAGMAAGSRLATAIPALTQLPRIARGIEGVAGAGFAAQMGKGIVDSAHEFSRMSDELHQAEFEGRSPEELAQLSAKRTQLATEAVLQTGLTALATKGAFRDFKSTALNTPYPNEMRQLDKLGYDASYPIGVNDSARILEGGMRAPLGSEDLGQTVSIKPTPTPQPKRTTPVRVVQPVQAQVTPEVKPAEVPPHVQPPVAPEVPQTPRRSISLNEPILPKTPEAQTPVPEERQIGPVGAEVQTGNAKPSNTLRADQAKRILMSSLDEREQLQKQLDLHEKSFRSDTTRNRMSDSLYATKQARLADVEGNITSSLRTFAQHGGKDELQDILEGLDKGAASETAKSSLLRKYVTNDITAEQLHNELLGKLSKEEREVRYRELGYKQVESFQVLNKAIKDPKVLENVKETQEVLKSYVGGLTEQLKDDPTNLDLQKEHQKFSNLLYEENKDPMGRRTGVRTLRNVVRRMRNVPGDVSPEGLDIPGAEGVFYAKSSGQVGELDLKTLNILMGKKGNRRLPDKLSPDQESELNAAKLKGEDTAPIRQRFVRDYVSKLADKAETSGKRYKNLGDTLRKASGLKDTETTKGLRDYAASKEPVQATPQPAKEAPKTLPAPVQAPAPANQPSKVNVEKRALAENIYRILSKGSEIPKETASALEQHLGVKILDRDPSAVMEDMKQFFVKAERTKKVKNETPPPPSETTSQTSNVEPSPATASSEAPGKPVQQAEEQIAPSPGLDSPAPRGVPEMVWSSINEAVKGLNHDDTTKKLIRDTAVSKYLKSVKHDPLAWKKIVDTIKGSDKEGLPTLRNRQKVMTGLVDRAAQAISSQRDVEVKDPSLWNEWGLAFFHDPSTGNTMAMELRDAQDASKVRAHIDENRKAMGAASGKLPADRDVNFALRNLPDTIRGIVQKLPEPIASKLLMSPGRAAYIVGGHVDPMLRMAMKDFNVSLSGVTPKEMPDVLGTHQFSSPKSKIEVRARGWFEKTLLSHLGEMSMNEVAAHEFGHNVFHKLSGLDEEKLTKQLRKAFPDAYQDISYRYNGNPSASEVFAHSFMDYYMGRGDTSRMQTLLKKHLSLDQFAQASALHSIGSIYKPDTNFTLADLAWGVKTNAPNEGLPLPRPVNRLMTSIAGMRRAPEDEAARALLRERTGDLARSEQQLFHQLGDIIKRHDSDSLSDLVRFMDAGEGKPGATFADPRDQAIANTLHGLWQDRWDALKTVRPDKFDGAGIPDYLSHVFIGPRQNAAAAIRNTFAKRPMEGPAVPTKHRFHEFLSDAVQAGATPITNNPISMQLHAMFQVDRYLMAHQFKADLEGVNLIDYFKLGKPAPAGWSRVNDKIFQPKAMQNGGLTSYGEWWAPEKVAKVINNYLSPGLRGNKLYDITRQYGNFINQLQLNFSAFHLTFETINSSLSDMAVGMEQMVNQKNYKEGMGRIIRGIIPAASAIHYYRLGKLLEQEYLEPGKYPHLSGLADAYARAGGRIGVDPFYENASADAFRKAWSDKKAIELPFRAMSATAEWSSRWLMKYTVPRIKLAAFAEAAQVKMDQLAADGITDRISISSALDKISDSIDNAHGQLVYDNLFWPKTMKDIGMLSVRSLGWNLGTFRELGGGMKDLAVQGARKATGQRAELTHRMAYTLALPVVAGFYGAVYNYLATGQAPQQKEDYFFPRTGGLDAGGKPERVSIPTYMKDVFAASDHSADTIVHKLHPMFSQMADLYRNEDFYGTEIYHGDDPIVRKAADVAQYLGKGMMPLSVQNFRERRRSGEGILSSMGAGLGFTPAPKYIGQSAAERLAFDLAKRHMEQGPNTRESFNKRQERSQIRNAAAQGNMGPLRKALHAQTINIDQAENILSEIKQSPLERHISRLRLDEVVAVYNRANEHEKAQIKPYIVNKLGTISSYPPEQQTTMLTSLRNALQ